MKKIKLLSTIVAVVLIAFACSKDQKVVRQLDGEWKMTALSRNGVAEDASSYENTTYTFKKCKVSKGDCEGSTTTNDPSKGDVTFPFTYSISEKGTKITINLEVFGFVESETGDIIEHSKSKFVWSVTDEDGDVTESTLEKI